MRTGGGREDGKHYIKGKVDTKYQSRGLTKVVKHGSYKRNDVLKNSNSQHLSVCVCIVLMWTMLC